MSELAPGYDLTLAGTLLDFCRARGLRLATAESCTGGLIAAALTAFPGASAGFERGFVTYSNAAKSEMLGVAPALIEAEGAVSRAVAAAMAAGALAEAHADFALSVTGIAGPEGGSAAKPVGLVWFGLAGGGRMAAHERRFNGDRTGIRAAAMSEGIALLQRFVRGDD